VELHQKITDSRKEHGCRLRNGDSLSVSLRGNTSHFNILEWTFNLVDSSRKCNIGIGPDCKAYTARGTYGMSQCQQNLPLTLVVDMASCCCSIVHWLLPLTPHGLLSYLISGEYEDLIISVIAHLPSFLCIQ